MRKNFLFSFVLLLSLSAFAQQSRHFTFHYAFTVRNLQPGKKIEIWFPRAHSDQFQDVKIVSVSGDLPLQKTRESKYGNTIFHVVVPKAAKNEYKFDVEYDVVRQERIGLPRNGLQPHLVKASTKQANEYLGPDKLVPITGKLADYRRKAGPRAYQHDGPRPCPVRVCVPHHADKPGTGWGRGDAEWACASPNAATALTFTRFSSRWHARSTSRHASRLASRYPLKRIRARLPVTTAGPSSTTHTMGVQSGFATAVCLRDN